MVVALFQYNKAPDECAKLDEVFKGYEEKSDTNFYFEKTTHAIVYDGITTGNSNTDGTDTKVATDNDTDDSTSTDNNTIINNNEKAIIKIRKYGKEWEEYSIFLLVDFLRNNT